MNFIFVQFSQQNTSIYGGLWGICNKCTKTSIFLLLKGNKPFILSFLYLSLFLIGVGAAKAASAHLKTTRLNTIILLHYKIIKRLTICFYNLIVVWVDVIDCVIPAIYIFCIIVQSNGGLGERSKPPPFQGGNHEFKSRTRHHMGRYASLVKASSL